MEFYPVIANSILLALDNSSSSKLKKMCLWFKDGSQVQQQLQALKALRVPRTLESLKISERYGLADAVGDNFVEVLSHQIIELSGGTVSTLKTIKLDCYHQKGNISLLISIIDHLPLLEELSYTGLIYDAEYTQYPNVIAKSKLKKLEIFDVNYQVSFFPEDYDLTKGMNKSFEYILQPCLQLQHLKLIGYYRWGNNRTNSSSSSSKTLTLDITTQHQLKSISIALYDNDHYYILEKCTRSRNKSY